MTSGLSSRHLATRAGFPMVAMCRHASGGGLNGDTSFWWDHCRSTKSRCPLAPKTGPARCCCRAVPAKLSGSIGSPDLSLEPPSGRIHGSKRPGCRMPAALRAADRRSMPSGLSIFYRRGWMGKGALEVWRSWEENKCLHNTRFAPPIPRLFLTHPDVAFPSSSSFTMWCFRFQRSDEQVSQSSCSSLAYRSYGPHSTGELVMQNPVRQGPGLTPGP